MDSIQVLTYRQIVERIVGKISPVGESNEDRERLENLKQVCHLTAVLLAEIENVYTDNKEAQQFSIKQAANYAKDFLINSIGLELK